LKLASVRRALSIADLPVEISRIVPADATLHHRNRMDYVFGPDGELGLKEPGRWDRPLDLETCLMLSEGGLETLRRVRAWAKGTPLKPWDNRRHQGYLRYLVIREGKNTGERMAMLVTAEGPLEDEAGLVEALAPLCSSIVHGINPSITDVSVAGMIRPLRGEALLHERVGGVRYRIHPNGFFQTNTAMAERLLEQVRASVAAGPHGRLLDLYCGSGFFALALASDVGEVLGVELDDKAIEDAHAAAADNGIGNARFRAEAAEALSWEDERPDVVVVDPPRSGLHPSVRRTLLERRPPRIVYVSCNPRALAADLAQLLEAYEADPAVCIDLFPHTPHVETVVGLRKR
jgi:23S rRNA (uracil1939-C5)-methyltransferase